MPSSLGGPDNGTGISCLTATLWTVGSAPSDYSTARCYYLVDGHIREVPYDGSNWLDWKCAAGLIHSGVFFNVGTWQLAELIELGFKES